MFCRHQEALAKSNIRLHKTATNNRNVMQAFPPEDRAKDLKDLDLGTEPLPLQKSLGLSWNIEMDHFTFSVSREDKNVTRRGILSTVNSLFHHKWEKPNESFQSNSTTGMRHCHCQNRNTGNFGETQWWSQKTYTFQDLMLQFHCLHRQPTESWLFFSDASVIAIAAVAYLKTIYITVESHVGFVMAKSKLAPRPAHSVQRLELCAAV